MKKSPQELENKGGVGKIEKTVREELKGANNLALKQEVKKTVATGMQIMG